LGRSLVDVLDDGESTTVLTDDVCTSRNDMPVGCLYAIGGQNEEEGDKTGVSSESG
jgi:hypothetical protein